ncbi:MAG: HD domain-containing protein [bacterium]|nr:HD domain-containing protein [bacterium]
MMSSERIVVVSGPGQGERVPINGTLSIGRSPDNLLQLNDLQVSRKHAVIEQTTVGTIIRDLGSGNGTFIGDQQVLEYRLTADDTIRIGTIELRYENDRPVAEQPPLPDTGQFGPPTDTAPSSAVRFRNVESSTVEASSAENVYKTFFQAPRQTVGAEELRAAQTRLTAVYEANQVISSEHDLKKLFGRVMDQLFSLVPAHNGVIMLADEDTGDLVTEHVKSGTGNGEVVISSTIVSRAFTHGEAVMTSDATDDARFDAGASIISQNISSAMCVPLAHREETLGVLYVDTRGTTNAFDQGDLELLVALAGPAAIAIKNAQYLARIEQGYQDTLTVLANSIEMRDHYTVGHTWRVTNFALAIARELGWPEEKLEECEMGGVLHDVGKIAVDDAILRKPSGLTDEEYAKMKIHPERGARLMQDVTVLVPLIPYALYHHERYDGKGYPFGLTGDEIPVEGRLVAVADTFDAMTSNRPYRKGLDPEFAISEMTKAKGTQLDHEIVDALVRCYKDGKIDAILQEYHKGAKSIVCPFCSTHIPIPEQADAGSEMLCTVCHRRVLLRVQNEAYYGELVAATAPISGILHKPDSDESDGDESDAPAGKG